MKKCFWIFNHDWENWDDVVWSDGKKKVKIVQNIPRGASIFQTRDCKICKKTQIREARTL